MLKSIVLFERRAIFMSSPLKSNPPRFYSPIRPNPQGLKKSSIISHETSSSNQQNEKTTNLKKKGSICDTALQRIKTSQLLCNSLRKKKSKDSSDKKNQETGASTLHQLIEQPKEVEEELYMSQLCSLPKKYSVREPETTKTAIVASSAHGSLAASTPLTKTNDTNALDSIQTMQWNMLNYEPRIKKSSPKKSEESPYKKSQIKQKKDSPRRQKESPQKRRAIYNPLARQIQKLEQARVIESFILSQKTQQQNQFQISYVEEQGQNILNWNICKGKASQFKIIKFIDQGQYGKVYLAQSYTNGIIYSVKTLYRHSMDASQLNQLVREVKIQSYADHPNIVKLYNFFVDQESAYLVLQPCLGHNLYHHLKEKGKMSEKTVKEYIRQVCTAVEYLHNQDIIHRDLKPENILLHENTIKICDFGWAIHSPLLRATQCGTPVYTPPQIVNKQPYDSKIDIWSIGVLTYQLLYGTIPFQIRRIDDLVKITQQEVYFSHEIVVSQPAKQFMAGCLNKNPLKRYSIRQLIQHQFLLKTQKFRCTVA